MQQNVLGCKMAFYFIQMFLLDIIILLTFVQPLPVAEKDDRAMAKSNEKNSNIFLKELEQENFNKDYKSSYRLKMEEYLERLKGFSSSSQKSEEKRTSLVLSKSNSKLMAEENMVQNLNSIASDKNSTNDMKHSEISDAQENRSKRQKRFTDWFSMDSNPYTNRIDEQVVDSNFDNTHVKQCSAEHKNYCHNGGICVYVVSLNIRTCRCPIQFTGRRCEALDIDVLMMMMDDGNSIEFPFP